MSSDPEPAQVVIISADAASHLPAITAENAFFWRAGEAGSCDSCVAAVAVYIHRRADLQGVQVRDVQDNRFSARHGTYLHRQSTGCGRPTGGPYV